MGGNEAVNKDTESWKVAANSTTIITTSNSNTTTPSGKLNSNRRKGGTDEDMELSGSSPKGGSKPLKYCQYHLRQCPPMVGFGVLKVGSY